MPRKYKIVLTVLAVVSMFGAVSATASISPAPDHVASFTEAVDRGLISGDPAYYYNGEAAPIEYAHAIMVAVLELDDRIVTYPPDASCPIGSTPQKYADPRTGVHLTQPNLPAFYIKLIAPDGRAWAMPAMGQYVSDVSGQWYVCYVEDIYEWLGSSTPTTTATTTTQGTSIPTPTTSIPTTTSTTSTSTSTTSSTTTTSTVTVPPSSTTLRITSDNNGWTYTGLRLSNPDGDCIVIEGATDVTITNSVIGPCGRYPDINAKAIYALNSANITITANDFVEESRNAVQFDKVRGGLIADNQVDYRVGETFAEDLINLFASHDIEVRDNYLEGGGPSNSGSCIMLGDADGSNQWVHGNVCINPGQVGIGVAGGRNITVEENYIRSLSYYWSNVGGYIWDQYGTACTGIVWRNNDIEWYNSSGSRNDFWDGGNCEVTYGQ